MNPTKISLPLIDLFAGCGGLSLGLEYAGFTPVFVNELHPDGLSTYLVNREELDVQRHDRHSNDILEITREPSRLESLANSLRGEYGELALVAGGPPCQGYSARGIRSTFSELQKHDIPSNYLYRDMAAFIIATAPKSFLFENVYGLINARWTKLGERGEIWNDVLSTFSNIEVKVGRRRLHYEIKYRVVKAKDFGVPQNRPRIILIGIRSDISVTDVETDLLFEPVSGPRWPDLSETLGDLVDNSWVNGGATRTYPNAAEGELQEYFRRRRDGRVSKKGDKLSEHEYSLHSNLVISRYQAMIDSGGPIPVNLKTLKFGQRLLPKNWGPEGPTITATSSPDDYVHYLQPRILSVREWARLQMFPDAYVFKGKRTTGGRRRAGDPSVGNWTRELPKYTQIGNAVPVMLAKAIGTKLASIVSQ